MHGIKSFLGSLYTDVPHHKGRFKTLWCSYIRPLSSPVWPACASQLHNDMNKSPASIAHQHHYF